MFEVADFASSYVRRVVDDELDELFEPLRAVLLDGPKGVGKTATATRRTRSMRRLDIAPQRAIVAADPAVISHDTPPLLIDEWQRVPEVFDVVRRSIDDDPTSGPFLLTGSAPTTETHSGAGRIATMRMRPLTLSERLAPFPGISFRDLLAGTADLQSRSPLGLADYAEEILAGGFPGLRHLDGRARTRQLDGYLERIVDHDLADLGFTSRRPAAVTAWLRAYAAAISTTASWEKIRDAATSKTSDKPARSTT